MTETFSQTDIQMMRRALQLAKCGEGRVSPNPMVGAVITARGRIIGEGYHRRWGAPHAEVNAVASVREEDLPLLPEATIYVTLEPCSHYGKTPPCAKLLVDKKISRVVIATEDPYAKVSGRGIAMLREAGARVEVGLLRDEARDLNRRFMTAHTLQRPFIQLKWAESADGFMGAAAGGSLSCKGEGASEDPERVLFSTPLSAVWMHRERSKADAIMVGTDTVIADNPHLDCRLWPGRLPKAVTFDSPRLPTDAHICDGRPLILKLREETLPDFMHRLYAENGITSLMVEGGAATLNEFVRLGLYDEVRVESAPFRLGEGLKAPDTQNLNLPESKKFACRENILRLFR